jgi:magnesium and cobalt transporter
MKKKLKKPRPRLRSWLSRLGLSLLGKSMEREDIIKILRSATERQLIGQDALDMIEGVFQVSTMQVRDIMVPRSQMVVLERDVSPEDFLPEMNEHGYSRYPVIKEDRDNVIGVLLAKDLLRYFESNQQQRFVLKDVLRQAVFVPESKRLNVLLADFRANRNHMAIVMNEYGGVAGLVTIEDVLEQIVGDIQDEFDYDEDDSMIRKNDEGFIVKALTPLEDFNDYFKSTFQQGDTETIGGLVTNTFSYLPERGESVTIDGFLFTVLHCDSRRINLLKLTLADGSEATVDSKA